MGVHIVSPGMMLTELLLENASVVNKQVGGGFRSRFRHLVGVRPLPCLPACLRAQARGKMCCL